MTSPAAMNHLTGSIICCQGHAAWLSGGPMLLWSGREPRRTIPSSQLETLAPWLHTSSMLFLNWTTHHRNRRATRTLNGRRSAVITTLDWVTVGETAPHQRKQSEPKLWQSLPKPQSLLCLTLKLKVKIWVSTCSCMNWKYVLFWTMGHRRVCWLCATTMLFTQRYSIHSNAQLKRRC